jgi:hypothetical protein
MVVKPIRFQKNPEISQNRPAIARQPATMFNSAFENYPELIAHPTGKIVAGGQPLLKIIKVLLQVLPTPAD